MIRYSLFVDISVAGGSLLHARAYEPIYLFATVHNANAAVGWSWQLVTSPTFALDPSSRSTSTLYIPPFTLQAGEFYTFVVNATSASTTTQSTVSVIVESTPPVAVIAGGTVCTQLSLILM